MTFNWAIIDADPIVYKAGFAAQKKNKETGEVELKPFKECVFMINTMMTSILEKTECNDYKAYLTSNDKSNFRFKLDSTYKSNRKDFIKPVHYDAIREYLEVTWKCEVVSGEEADDRCSYEHLALCYEGVLLNNNAETNSIVCSIDKDFNNIPGWHYNPDKDITYFISTIETLRHFYLQILIGDPIDGIPRIKKGWKQKETELKINRAINEKELYDIISIEIQKVLNISKDEIEQLILKRGQLLWLRRVPGEIWKPNI